MFTSEFCYYSSFQEDRYCVAFFEGTAVYHACIANGAERHEQRFRMIDEYKKRRGARAFGLKFNLFPLLFYVYLFPSTSIYLPSHKTKNQKRNTIN